MPPISGGGGIRRRRDTLVRCLLDSFGRRLRRFHGRAARQGLPFEMLEPYEGKLSRTVLRGERGRKAPDLPGLRHEVAYFDCSKEVNDLRLNLASRRCDPMEACAHGASMVGMKPS